jgi:hypothetical protein
MFGPNLIPNVIATHSQLKGIIVAPRFLRLHQKPVAQLDSVANHS